MLILGIQTAEYPNSVALIDEKNLVLGEHVFEKKEQTIEGLGESVKKLLEEKNRESRSRKPESGIDMVCVCLGPGSYTGLRGGLAFAKGYCQFSKIPLVGVTAFDALRADVKKDVIVLLDARHERVYYQNLQLPTNKTKQSKEPKYAVDNIEEVMKKAKGNSVYIGSGAVEYKNSIVGKGTVYEEKDVHELTAVKVAEAGLKNYKKDSSIFSKQFLYKVQPLYILPPNITKSKK